MILNGYLLAEGPWVSRGGGGQCIRAEKDGVCYFIKRMNEPKYPLSDHFSREYKTRTILECEQWLKRREAITKALPSNVVRPLEYFRAETYYYEVTLFVEEEELSYGNVWKLSFEERVRLLWNISRSLYAIHDMSVVHGDLNPSNIMLSRNERGELTAKLIDFSDAFFETDVPDAVMTKDAWCSPEVAFYGHEGGEGYRNLISCKADVFSLGLVFHQYCTDGARFPRHSGHYPWQGFAGGGTLEPDPGIEPELRYLIGAMLRLEPDDRPDMCQVFRYLTALRNRGKAGVAGFAL